MLWRALGRRVLEQLARSAIQHSSALPFFQRETSSLTSGLKHRIIPTKPSMLLSVTLLTISILRPCRNDSTAFRTSLSFRSSCDKALLMELWSLPYPTSSTIAEDNRGVDVPDRDPSIPLKPLGGRNLGAGSPFKKCSSSASVPLSLFVDSRYRSEIVVWLSCSSSSWIPAGQNAIFGDPDELNRSEA